MLLQYGQKEGHRYNSVSPRHLALRTLYLWCSPWRLQLRCYQWSAREESSFFHQAHFVFSWEDHTHRLQALHGGVYAVREGKQHWQKKTWRLSWVADYCALASNRWLQSIHHSQDKSPSSRFTVSDIHSAMRSRTTPGCDNIHAELPKTWTQNGCPDSCPRSLFRILQFKDMKNGQSDCCFKVRQRSSSRCQLSAYFSSQCVRVCYELLERLTLKHISPVVEELLSADQAVFHTSWSTCNQVAALITFIYFIVCICLCCTNPACNRLP